MSKLKSMKARSAEHVQRHMQSGNKRGSDGVHGSKRGSDGKFSHHSHARTGHDSPSHTSARQLQLVLPESPRHQSHLPVSEMEAAQR